MTNGMGNKSVVLQDVRKSYGSLQVVHGIDLTIAEGEFVVFVGPSGCGKSTLLRMIAGLEDVTDGEIEIKGRLVTDLDPSERGIAMVFQSYALYPHMSVRDNLAFGLKMARTSPADIETRVKAASAILKIDHLLDRRPGQLSGGQRQRVAIGRAIVRKPDVFLFDEPLSNLDAELRVSMRIEIARLHRELGNTMIYVTHDQTEAMTLADKIVVLRDGRVEQAGTPREIYEDPANTFVAGFIGSPRMNLLNARWRGKGLVEVAGSRIESGLAWTDGPAASAVTLGLRPEHLKVASGQSGSLTARVDFSEYLGGTQYLYCQLADGQSLTVEHRSPVSIAAGEEVSLLFEPSDCRLFDEGGKRLR
ncbi:ABC transporter ATP-binding protein [Rhizobium sp. R635]|uniref:ABC transporter ATP-binding protein n=1 Tax=Rhizobium sp. R635 TaxID=1764275 RepID=UPI000B52D436|nr:sn-glycerol-3-phosphate ABC transporter ATP-binding protein UgpC [Rhizobium sp. R635]OWV86468.1 ABC transporter ATP-binding protein [Rhizobium sp. R635]